MSTTKEEQALPQKATEKIPETSRTAHQERMWQSSQKILRYVNRAHQLSYSLTKRLAGGYLGGAYLLTDHKAQHAVLKWDRRKFWADRVTRAAPVVEQARRAGWSTPSWLVVGTSPSGYPYVVQEFVVAAPTEAFPSVTCQVVAAALEFVQSQAGLRLETEVDWTAWDRNILFDHEINAKHADSIRQYSAAGAALVEELQSWMEQFRDIELTTSDLVHGDFHPGNLLYCPDCERECKVIAAIDVEALGRGTRLHDVANMATHCILWPGQVEALQLLNRYGRENAKTGEWEVCVAARLYERLHLHMEHSKEGGPAEVLERATQFVKLVQRGQQASIM